MQCLELSGRINEIMYARVSVQRLEISSCSIVPSSPSELAAFFQAMESADHTPPHWRLMLRPRACSDRVRGVAEPWAGLEQSGRALVIGWPLHTPHPRPEHMGRPCPSLPLVLCQSLFAEGLHFSAVHFCTLSSLHLECFSLHIASIEISLKLS